MLFNSLHFLLYFPIVGAFFFLLPARFRACWLLLASAYFYMAFKPSYILILCLVISIDYVSGLCIEGANGRRRRLFLALSLLSNGALLGVFKYWNFAARNLEALGCPALPLLDLVLPIGLSFHTFQSMAYTIEVYRGTVAAERRLHVFALYVLFYPQLVAGPIERPTGLLPQLRELTARFESTRIARGLRLMLWGLFKKIVIADRLAIYVNGVFANPGVHGLPIILATVFFAVQIYCDFSGYTDIALGAALTMGVQLRANFRRPYMAVNIVEFWHRWHMSLSTWFRDYLYIPLGGSRGTPQRVYFNLMFTFMISGLWHGANWTYVAWGFLHGLYLILHRVLAPLRSRCKLGTALSRLVTNSLVCVAWVFFRAPSLERAFYLLSHSVPRHLLSAQAWNLAGFCPYEQYWDFGVSLLLLSLLGWLWHREEQADKPFVVLLERAAWPLRWGTYYLLVVSILLLGKYTDSEFIYFQF